MSLVIENGELIQYIEEPGITEVVIPDHVTSIGNFAFYYACKSITSIMIPDNVAGIESVAFDNCQKLINITVSEDNPLYCDIDGIVFSKDKTKLLVYPRGRSGEYAIPNGVISIKWWAFSHCKSLTNITFPDSLKYIGDFAFWGCKSLTQITIPDSVISIGNDVFSGCKSLKRIDVSPDNRFFSSVDAKLYNKDKTKLIYDPEDVFYNRYWYM